jgi:hypothetical protein
MDLQQPDPEDPDRLLGLCHECDDWFLLQALPCTGAVVIMRLPRAEEVRRAATARGHAAESTAASRAAFAGALSACP